MQALDDEQHIGEALKHFPENDPRVHAIKHDVMDRDSWERVADEIEKKFGGLQVLVNNAGVGLQAPASTLRTGRSFLYSAPARLTAMPLSHNCRPMVGK